MPSSYRSYHQPPRYQYSQPPLNIPIPANTVAIIVAVCFAILYYLLSDLLQLPSGFELIARMAGVLFGPAAREKLQHVFSTSPRQVMSQVVRKPFGGKGGSVGGLWNMGNTCYQNSVLQSLASLESLKPWLASIEDGVAAVALQDLVEELNEVTEKPRIKTASTAITQGSGGAKGWRFNEQQDAQEFLQGLMGVLEKEMAEVVKYNKEDNVIGLEGVLDEKAPEVTVPEDSTTRSPFEGLLAQRVGCLNCGYVEGITLQPFTTLTLPIPSSWTVTLEDCLSAFTAIEPIQGVDCDKCTLNAVQQRLKTLLTASEDPSADPSTALTPAIRETIVTRLAAINAALEEDNFTPKIPGVKLDGAHKVSSTKTKQVMISRTPEILVLHTNRSTFDMNTGMMSKNHATVRFPATLNLSRFITSHENLSTDPGQPISVLKPVEDGDEEAQGGFYGLKAIVTHYGGHHNGHYVAYRNWANRWWRISDHDVNACTEDDALAAGNAFMLFYERLSAAELHRRRVAAKAAIAAISTEAAINTPLPDSEPASEDEDWDGVDTSVNTSQLLLTPPDSESGSRSCGGDSGDEAEGNNMLRQEHTPPLEPEAGDPDIVDVVPKDVTLEPLPTPEADAEEEVPLITAPLATPPPSTNPTSVRHRKKGRS